MRFGYFDPTVHEDLAQTLGSTGPMAVVLKDGIVYHNKEGKDWYAEMHEFIESLIP